jgi:hypothetical protein
MYSNVLSHGYSLFTFLQLQFLLFFILLLQNSLGTSNS